ncbi:MAG: efflux RND transporter periplasmic adaptor subunit [Gammaproteobacteria bacterium]|nr:efflux RND transporter periplasmic adaptor subunit [Gammaproteobacteria bacterium]
MDIAALLRRKALWIVVIGLLLAVVLWRCSSGGKAAPAYVTEPLARGDIVARVSASGSLSAVVTVEVGSQVSGRIQSLFADFNSVVRKGERIAKIDPALFEAAVEQAQANVVAARGNLARLQAQSEESARQARRATQLFDQRIVSENDRDAAVSSARAAAAAVQQAEGQLSQTLAALRQAQTNLRYTDIVAPTDGIVISRAVNVGQTVAASLQAPVIFTIAQDLRAMEVHTNVAESDIGRLQAGMAASFTVDAYPNERFTGRIREIRNAPQVVQNVVTYDAVIDVANPDLRLKPGMTATVAVIADRRSAVLRVPNAALRFRPAGDESPTSSAAAGRRAVFVLEQGRLQRRELTVGLSDGRYTEVTGGGLREGEVVVTGAEGGAAGGTQRGMRMRIL